MWLSHKETWVCSKFFRKSSCVSKIMLKFLLQFGHFYIKHYVTGKFSTMIINKLKFQLLVTLIGRHINCRSIKHLCKVIPINRWWFSGDCSVEKKGAFFPPKTLAKCFFIACCDWAFPLLAWLELPLFSKKLILVQIQFQTTKQAIKDD